MLKRWKTWHILTAGLIGLAPACSKARHEQPARKAHAAVQAHDAGHALPPITAPGAGELTAVQPPPAPVSPQLPDKADIPADVDEALDRLALEAQRKPQAAGPQVNLARALLDAGKIKEAREHAERATEIDEKSSAAWNMLGRIQLTEKELDDAAGSFQHAVEYDPDSSFAWNNLGYVALEQGRYDDAVSALENATSGAKPTGYMWNNLGMAYEHSGRIREARAAYRQAATAGSTRGDANLHRLEGVRCLEGC